MLKKIHPKIIGLLFLTVFILLFFLLSIYRNNRDFNKSIASLNHIQDVSRDIQKMNALLVKERSDARKYILSGKPEMYQQVMTTRTEVFNAIEGVKSVFAADDSVQQTLGRLKQLLGSAYFIQDSSLQMRRNGVTARQVQLNDSIHAATNHLLNVQHEKMFNTRKLFARGIQSDTTQILIGGCIVFIFVIIILIRFNKENQRLNIVQQEATASELKYRSLIENAGQVMYTADLDGRITFANRKATYLTGYSTEELIGMHISKLIDPSMRHEVLQNYATQVRYRIPETIRQFNMITKQGELKLIGQSAIMIFEAGEISGFQCSVWDVNEMSQIRRNLRESEMNLKKNTYQLQSILDNTNALMYVKDLEGRYQIVNRRFLDMLNMVEDRVINKTDYELTSKERADLYYEMDQQVIRSKQGMETEVEIDALSGSGKRVLLLGKFPLLDENGDIFGVCGIGTDITERINYQKELIQARSDAESATRLQEQFLANMSHEIRTPMNGIQGMTELLITSQLTEQQREFVTFIKRCVNNLLVLINDILDFSKIQAGKLSIEEIPFDLRKVISNVQMDFAHRLKEKGLGLAINITNEVPKTLIGDPYRLTQVLVNFVSNAIKFTEKGNITLTSSVLHQKENSVVLQIIIEDPGIGIAQENLESIFESFNQGNKSTTRIYGGTGLGLAICKQLVEMQGGTVAVASTLGEGSKFVVNIPYKLSETDAEQAGIVAEEPGHYVSLLSGKRILAAEDNEVNKNLLMHVLKKIGINADIVNNGQEAVDKLKQNRYDAIIMDLQMPVMDGYTATKYIREEMKVKTPILAMTATAMRGEIAKCLAIGMNDYMSKPFNFTDLYDKLVKLIGMQDTTVKRQLQEAAKKEEKLYDLSMLEELGDKRNMIEMIDMVISNMGEQLGQMQTGIVTGDWQKVAQIAHKAKSSIGMLRVTELLQLMNHIEQYSKEEGRRNEVGLLHEKASHIFAKLAHLLSEDRDRFKKELEQKL